MRGRVVSEAVAQPAGMDVRERLASCQRVEDSITRSLRKEMEGQCEE